MTNAINPSHYKSDTIECIDAMKACSTPEEFRGHLKLTVLKYLWREDKKGEGDQARVENLEKAAWYLERLVKDLRKPEFAEPGSVAEAIYGLKLDVNGNVSGFECIPDAFEVIPPHTINAADQGWIDLDGTGYPDGFSDDDYVEWQSKDYGNKCILGQLNGVRWNGKPGAFDVIRIRRAPK